MIERYSRKELKDIWEDHNKYSIWLDIELAATEAMEKLKLVPRGVAKKVRSKSKIINCCNGGRYDKLISDLGSKKQTPAVGAALNLIN